MSHPNPSNPSASSSHANLSKQYRTHTCRNCGLVGHLYKDCPHPIMSFGLICFRVNSGQPEYIMIQRRDSLSFMEFIRGKYRVEDVSYICNLLSMMTQSERQQLLDSSFHSLWNQVWYQPSISKHTQEYLESKTKFDALKTGFYHNKIFVNLALLVKSTYSQYVDPEWGFPKGRRKLREEDIDCAIREYCEETGCKKSDVEVLKHLQPVEEIFYGTNKVLYRHVYYICAFTNSNHKVGTVDPKNIQQAREVRQVRWFNYDRVLANIRPHNKERRALFHHAHTTVCAHLGLPPPQPLSAPAPPAPASLAPAPPVPAEHPAHPSPLEKPKPAPPPRIASMQLKADAPCFVYGGLNNTLSQPAQSTEPRLRGPPPGFGGSNQYYHH